MVEIIAINVFSLVFFCEYISCVGCVDNAGTPTIERPPWSSLPPLAPPWSPLGASKSMRKLDQV